MQKTKTKAVKTKKSVINKAIIVTKTVEPEGKTLFPKKLKMVNAILSNTVFME